MKKVTDFEVLDCGIDNPSYFQGIGTAYSDYEHATYGVGDTPAEAFEDMLEMMAGTGEADVDDELVARIKKELGVKGDLPDHPSAWREMLEANGIPADFDPEEDFDLSLEDCEDEEEFEEEQDEHERLCKLYEELQNCESNYYHMGIRWCSVEIPEPA